MRRADPLQAVRRHEASCTCKSRTTSVCEDATLTVSLTRLRQIMQFEAAAFRKPDQLPSDRADRRTWTAEQSASTTHGQTLRQVHPNRGPGAGITVYPYAPVVLPHHSCHQRQAQPQRTMILARGEERIKDPRQDARIDPGTIVANTDAPILTRHGTSIASQKCRIKHHALDGNPDLPRGRTGPVPKWRRMAEPTR